MRSLWQENQTQEMLFQECHCGVTQFPLQKEGGLKKNTINYRENTENTLFLLSADVNRLGSSGPCAGELQRYTSARQLT